MHIRVLLAALLKTTTGRYPRSFTSVVDTDLCFFSTLEPRYWLLTEQIKSCDKSIYLLAKMLCAFGSSEILEVLIMKIFTFVKW